jgi:hypothetical protein
VKFYRTLITLIFLVVSGGLVAEPLQERLQVIPVVEEEEPTATPFKLPFLRKLAILPGRFAEEFFAKLASYVFQRKPIILQGYDRKIACQQRELDALNNLSPEHSPSKANDFKTEIYKKIIELRRDKGIAEVSADLNIATVQAADWARGLIKAPGYGWLESDLVCDAMAKSPAFKVLYAQGMLPSKNVLRWLARVVLVADPIVTGGNILKILDFVFRSSIAYKDLGVCKDVVANRLFGRQLLDLGDPESFFTAQHIDSLRALPAVAEIVLLKLAASVAANACIGKDGQIDFAGLRADGIYSSPDSWQGVGQDLRKQNFFKADVLLTYRYLKSCLQAVVGDRICNFSNPRIFEAVYQKTYGMVDKSIFSFLGSLFAVHTLNKAPINRIINLKMGDANIIANSLVGEANADCLLQKNVLDSTAQFEPRPMQMAITRFALQKLVARAIFAVLKQFEDPLSSWFEQIMDLKNMLFSVANITDVVRAKQELKAIVFKRGKGGIKHFEFDLHQEAGIPFKIVFNTDGLELFQAMKQGDTIKMIKIDNNLFFNNLAYVFNEPTFNIESERSNVFAKWLSELLSCAIVAPLLENLFCGSPKLKHLGLFEEHQEIPFRSSILGYSIKLTAIFSAWVTFTCLRKWIITGIKDRPSAFELARLQRA